MIVINTPSTHTSQSTNSYYTQIKVKNFQNQNAIIKVAKRNYFRIKQLTIRYSVIRKT